jgi:hypothetical protein
MAVTSLWESVSRYQVRIDNDVLQALSETTLTLHMTSPQDPLVRFLLGCVPKWWRMHNGGSDWSAWPAHLSFFRHVAKLDLPIYEKWQHYEDAALHGASRFMHSDFWVVSDRQTSNHRDAQNRLHNETGPARTWGDGWAVWYWHGTPVPRSLIEDGWTVEQILREENAEVRRCAIERMGWPEFVEAANLQQVGPTIPDPGNADQQLALYDLPQQIFDEPVRILICTNGTPERDGTRRQFGLTVPASCTTPLAAAGWGYGLTAAEYAQLARRT